MAETNAPRIHAREHELVPRILIRAVIALVLASLALVTVARLTDRPLEATPPLGEVQSSRSIYLSGDASGAARILDETGTVIATFASDKGGFIAGIERVIRRERQKARVAQDGPVQLILRTGNRLSILDPTTNWSAELMGFGADNLRVFARLLEPPTEGS